MGLTHAAGHDRLLLADFEAEWSIDGDVHSFSDKKTSNGFIRIGPGRYHIQRHI